jgi:hypothetical protein
MASAAKPTKHRFRIARVLEVFPLSGEITLRKLVETYNDRYRSRILARLNIDKWFGVFMTEERMSRILKTLHSLSYLKKNERAGNVLYSLTARGVQAKLSKNQ